MAKRKPASETVIDGVASAGDNGLSTGTAVVVQPAPKSLWQRPAGPVTFDHPTLAEIARLKEEYGPLAAQVETPEGYEAVRKAIRHLVPLRTGVDELRLEAGREARAYVGEVNAAGNLLISKIKEIEEPLVAAKEAVDKAKEREALAKALAIEAEQKRLEDERLAKIKAEEDAKKAAELEAMRRQQLEIDHQRAVMEAERAEQQAKIDAERAEMDRQRKEFEQQRAEQIRQQEEARAKIEEERRRIEDAKLAAARAEEEAKQKEIRAAQEAEAEARRIKELEAATKRAAQEAEAAAEKRFQEAELRKKEQEARDQAAAQAKAEREAREAAEKAAKAPDRVKLRAFMDQIENLEPPAMKTKEGSAVWSKFWVTVSAAIDQADVFCKGK